MCVVLFNYLSSSSRFIFGSIELGNPALHNQIIRIECVIVWQILRSNSKQKP